MACGCCRIYLISAVLAGFAAVVGFLVGVLAAGAITPFIFRIFFPPDCECPVLGFILLAIIALPTCSGECSAFLYAVFGSISGANARHYNQETDIQ